MLTIFGDDFSSVESEIPAYQPPTLTTNQSLMDQVDQDFYKIFSLIWITDTSDKIYIHNKKSHSLQQCFNVSTGNFVVRFHK